MNDDNLSAIRHEYLHGDELVETAVATDPFEQFDRWLREALASDTAEPTAMTLSTVGRDMRPASRIVLLKGYDTDGFVFYTNYHSRKGHDIAANRAAVVNFFWAEIERQVNIAGTVTQTSDAESDVYFASRPFDSQIAAWASDQSAEIASRQVLEERFSELNEKYAHAVVPRPPNWGGYRLVPDRFEFWQGRASRLHDRLCYEKTCETWSMHRLAP